MWGRAIENHLTLTSDRHLWFLLGFYAKCVFFPIGFFASKTRLAYVRIHFFFITAARISNDVNYNEYQIWHARARIQFTHCLLRLSCLILPYTISLCLAKSSLRTRDKYSVYPNLILIYFSGELLLLLWGVYLCVKVRKAPSAFNEAKYISVCIYNKALMSLFSLVLISL